MNKSKTKARRVTNEVIFEPEPLFDDEKVIQRQLAFWLLGILTLFIGAAIVAWHIAPFGEWIAAVLIAIPISGLILLLNAPRNHQGSTRPLQRHRDIHRLR